MDAHIEQIAKSLYFSCKQFDIGLFYGKMGRCLFFFDYSRVTELRAFEELAGELLDEVVESVCLGMPVGLSFGWAGIGWGGRIWYVLLRLSSGDKGVRIGEKNYLSDLKSACEKALKKGRYEGILLLLDFLNGKRANYPFGEFFSQIPGEAHYIPDM